MNSDYIPIFITAASISVLAIRAVVADRFMNSTTSSFVLIGGIIPWFTVALLFRWLPEWPIVVMLAFGGFGGSGLIFSAALFRYWLGPRFDGWERATIAMVAAVLAVVGFVIAVGAVFQPFIRY